MEDNQVVVDPNLIEVDAITQAVDPNDAIMDEHGEVIQYFDREANKTYVKKGTTPIKTKEEPASPDAGKEAKDKGKKADDTSKAENKTQSAKKDDADPAKKKDDGDDEGGIESVNAADYILKKTGYAKDEIAIEGIEKPVKIADLNPEQQIDVIVSEFENTIEQYEKKVKDLEARKPELKFDDPQAQTLVDYLKNGGDLKRLAKEILSSDPAAQAQMLSDNDVVKLDLQKKYPAYSEQDIADEMKEMSEAQLARRAKAARADMQNAKPDYSNLTKEQVQAQKDAETQILAEFENQKTSVITKAKELNEIAGVKISQQIKDFLLSQVLPEKHDGNSKFVEALSESPEKLLRLQFLDSYHEKLMKQTADHYFKKGLAEGNRGKEKLSDEPVRTYSSSASGKKAGAKSIDEEEFFEIGEF